MNSNIYRGDLVACRVCLSTDVKLISLQETRLKNTYTEFSGVPISATDGLPQHICVFCCALLKKSSEFRQKCKATYTLLSGHLLEIHALTTSYIETLDRSHLQIPLKDTGVLECNCVPDDEIFPTEPTVKRQLKTESESAPISDDERNNEPLDFECFDNNEDYYDSYKEIKSEDEVLKEEFPVKKVEKKHKEVINKREIVSKKDKKVKRKLKTKDFPPVNKKQRITDKDEDRVEDFKSKYCSKVMNSDKETFYCYILEKYLQKCKKSNARASDLNTDYPAYINLDSQDMKAQVKIEISNPNTNQTKFYEFINNKYGNSTASKDKKEVRDIGKMKIRKIAKGTITKEYLEDLSKECNFDVVLMLKEEKIQDLLNRKETEKYKKAAYKCELCYTGFATEKTYQNHKAIHDPSSGPHECEICRVRFKNKKLWRSHIGARHRYKFICRQCGQVLRSTTDARDHHRFHSGVSYPCEHCGKTFEKYATRTNHVRIHHGSVTCDICQMKFTGEAGLVTHKTKAHKEMFKCTMCGTPFHNANAMLRHTQVTAAAGCGPHIRPCTKCGESFTDADLTQHMMLKHGHENKRLKNLRQPYRRRRGRDEEPFTYMCEVCGRDGFKHESTLRYHQQKHSDVRSVECDVCKKQFKDKYQLRIHMTIHTDERRFQCRCCLKAFRQQQHLTSHMKTHTNEKPFSCDICQKQFKYSTSLAEHTRTVHECLPPRKRMRRDT
ncbi:zinc-finger associated domain (zf-AD) domain-containing protein [Phthorimaea operculella]|nr:zinc-finger associated domain (zf-AD) domain-containing protein [Phthorimaea operculella]